ERGLATASLAGGLLTTFGTTATATGVGAVLVGAAVAGTALYAHYQQVQASNEFENDTTRKFLLHAVSDLELENADEVTDNLIRHLANADDRGSLPGRVFQGTAEALGIPPDEFFNQLAQLPEDQ